MSTKGRSMRSKVEKRMARETGRTQRELRRAVKLRKKLMTEDEKLIYNLRRAKKKVALLLQKLKKYELPDLPAPRHDPELLIAEQLQAYKKIGFRNRNYSPDRAGPARGHPFLANRPLLNSPWSKPQAQVALAY